MNLLLDSLWYQLVSIGFIYTQADWETCDWLAWSWPVILDAVTKLPQSSKVVSYWNEWNQRSLMKFNFWFDPNLTQMLRYFNQWWPLKSVSSEFGHRLLAKQLFHIVSFHIKYQCHYSILKGLKLWGNCWIQHTASHMMIDLQQVQNGISCINDFDVRLISRPACVLFNSCAEAGSTQLHHGHCHS